MDNTNITGEKKIILFLELIMTAFCEAMSDLIINTCQLQCCPKLASTLSTRG